MALALPADRRLTAIWMSLSLAIWSLVTVTLTLAGFEGLAWLRGDRSEGSGE